MQENEDERQESKQPIEMTSEELLDYSIAPEVAERLKTLVHDDDESNDESD
ncbi:MAG TPA: hypothetical protein VGQ72_13330 [Pyrinomonadaceae bacterium]|jgi:hypothetical protein|nr:hypothetical protein [Pyrinomonadaceae bacterium]